GGSEAVGGVGDGQCLGAGLGQRRGETALAVGERRVGRHDGAGRGVAAAEVDRAAVRRDRVAAVVLGGHRYAERLAGDGGRRYRQLEVVHDRRAGEEGTEDRRRRLLDARIHLDGGPEVVERPAP